tara:strand:- start:243 stop:455 length:213 start_codon:yes stop_codon:yes gene_type:complete
MNDFLDGLLSDSVTETTTELGVEDTAWQITDILLETGAVEAVAVATGAPFALIVGIRIFKKWRKGQKKNA